MSSTSARLSELQARIHEWCAEQFPEQRPLTILTHLKEEAAELGERRTAEEAADCLILLLAWAAHADSALLRTCNEDLLLWIGQSAGDLAYYATISADDNQRTESAYLLALLIGWSVLSGHDLLAAAEAKHAVNLTRSWARGADGIHRHVKDGGQ